MHPRFVIAVRTGRLLLRRMTDWNDSERYDMLRNAEHFSKTDDAVFARIYPDPDASQTFSMNSDQEVFCCRRTVLHPIPYMLFEARVATDKDSDKCFPAHQGVGMNRGYLVKDLPVIDDHKVPRLLIASRRSAHGGFQYLSDRFF